MLKINNSSKLILNYRRLMNTKRCNNFPVIHNEDVAHHSYFVTMMAVLIAKQYNKSVAEHNKNLHHYDDGALDIFDIPSLYEKGMFHDVEEAFFSDIPRNIKHHSEEVNKAIEKAVKEKLDQAYEGTGVAGEYSLQCNLEAKSDKEGQLIDIVDMLELGIYCAEEISCGNDMMTPLRDKAARIIRSHAMFESLFERSEIFGDLFNLINSDKPLMIATLTESIDIN